MSFALTAFRFMLTYPFPGWIFVTHPLLSALCVSFPDNRRPAGGFSRVPERRRGHWALWAELRWVRLVISLFYSTSVWVCHRVFVSHTPSSPRHTLLETSVWRHFQTLPRVGPGAVAASAAPWRAGDWHQRFNRIMAAFYRLLHFTLTGVWIIYATEYRKGTELHLKTFLALVFMVLLC